MSNRQYFTWSLYFGLQSKGNIRLSFPAHNTTSIAHTDSVVNAKRYVNTSVSALSKCWRTAVRHCIDRLHFHALTYLAGKSAESLQLRQLVCRFFISGPASSDHVLRLHPPTHPFCHARWQATLS